MTSSMLSTCAVLKNFLRGSLGLSRRVLRGKAALAGLLLAGVCLFGPTLASAAPCITSNPLTTRWGQVNGNWSIGNFVITSQSGSSFSGTAYGDPMTGTITGTPGQGRPVTVVFVRRLVSGEPQIWTGGYSETGPGTCNTNAAGQMMMGGVFYHNGAGPFPWFVTGTYCAGTGCF